MRIIKLYHDDFSKQRKRRDTEDSKRVVSTWFDPMAKYALEDIPETQCLRLVAERIIVRRLIGLDELDKDYESRVANVEVFGPGTPRFSELMSPNVFIAMAFVPLTPRDNDDKGKPVLARLYCVRGLKTSYSLPLEGMDDEPLFKGFSWFIEGVPSEMRDRGINGRSWCLAAHLLFRIVYNRDEHRAKNLAKHFIVTGDVKDELICPVEMGRKIELADQFKNFKWIIPKDTEMNIAQRKLEKPATLEEAYKLIESMHNVATKSMFRFLRSRDFEGVKQQYKNGADVYSREKVDGLTPLQIVEEEIKKVINEKSKSDNEAQEKLDKEFNNLKEIKEWLQRLGVDCAFMYYMLAKLKNTTALESCLETYPINSIDGNGLTAVDWALNAEEWDVAKILHSYGGCCNPVYTQNKKLYRIIDDYFSEDMGDPFYEPDSEEEKAIKADRIKKIIENGFSPDNVIDSSDGSPCSSTCTLFGFAISSGDYKVVEACLKAGVDLNKELKYYGFDHTDPFEGVNVYFKGLPIEAVKKFVSKENKDKFIKLLLSYGATDTNRIIK